MSVTQYPKVNDVVATTYAIEPLLSGETVEDKLKIWKRGPGMGLFFLTAVTYYDAVNAAGFVTFFGVTTLRDAV